MLLVDHVALAGVETAKGETKCRVSTAKRYRIRMTDEQDLRFTHKSPVIRKNLFLVAYSTFVLPLFLVLSSHQERSTSNLKLLAADVVRAPKFTPAWEPEFLESN